MVDTNVILVCKNDHQHQVTTLSQRNFHGRFVVVVDCQQILVATIKPFKNKFYLCDRCDKL